MSNFRTAAIQAVISLGLAATALPAFSQAPAMASTAVPVVASIDISDQRMKVYIDGAIAYEWKVSTGRRGHVTPTGAYKPYRMHEIWYSRKYDNAPMPHSVFFYGGYAVHATNAVSKLGHPASHGCIRLDPANAETFYNLVSQVGKENAEIIISQ